jgi:hypothetical protein
MKLKKTIRRYMFGYAFGIVLCFIGLIALFFVVWEAWPQMSANSEPWYDFWTILWEENINLIPNVSLKLMYFLILAVAMLVSGVAVLAFSRQRFVLPNKTMRVECPFCRKQWQISYNPGRVLCPHCQHLVHPKMIGE